MAPIFPLAHTVEVCESLCAHNFPVLTPGLQWEKHGYHLRITDPVFASSTKIKSVQNMILMRKDLHESWVNHEFGVDPDVSHPSQLNIVQSSPTWWYEQNNYRVTAFINGLRDIDGLTLNLDHIKDPTRRPLDELFRDHFRQGLLKYVKGLGEPGLEDLGDFLEPFDLESQPEDTPYPNADECEPNASGQDNRIPVAPAAARQPLTWESISRPRWTHNQIT